MENYHLWKKETKKSFPPLEATIIIKRVPWEPTLHQFLVVIVYYKVGKHDRYKWGEITPIEWPKIYG